MLFLSPSLKCKPSPSSLNLIWATSTNLILPHEARFVIQLVWYWSTLSSAVSRTPFSSKWTEPCIEHVCMSCHSIVVFHLSAPNSKYYYVLIIMQISDFVCRYELWLPLTHQQADLHIKQKLLCHDSKGCNSYYSMDTAIKEKTLQA